VEPVRSDVGRGDPQAARSPLIILELAVAPGRGIRENQWRDTLSLACRGSQRRGARGLRHQAPGSQGCAEVSETGAEAIWSAKDRRDGPASVVWGCDEGHRHRGASGMWALAQQPGRKLTSAVPTKRGRDGEIQGHRDLTEICRHSRLDPQPLPSGPPPQPPRHLQAKRAVALAEWRKLAA
jgi:hypothetical protein